MVTVPAETPVKLPEPVPIVAIAPLLLIQVPPNVPSPNIVDEPTHTLLAPVITPGVRLTVTTWDARQPVPNV